MKEILSTQPWTSKPLSSLAYRECPQVYVPIFENLLHLGVEIRIVGSVRRLSHRVFSLCGMRGEGGLRCSLADIDNALYIPEGLTADRQYVRDF